MNNCEIGYFACVAWTAITLRKASCNEEWRNMNPSPCSSWALERVHEKLTSCTQHNDSSIFLHSQRTSSLSQMDKQWHGVENSEEHVHFRLFNMSIGEITSRARFKRLQASCYNFLERPSGAVSLSYHFLVWVVFIILLLLIIIVLLLRGNYRKCVSRLDYFFLSDIKWEAFEDAILEIDFVRLLLGYVVAILLIRS